MHNTLLKDSGSIEFSKRLLDAVIVVIAAHITAYFYLGKTIEELAPVYSLVMYFCAGMVFYLFPKLQLYASWRGRSMSMMFIHLVLAWGMIVSGGVFVSYLIHLSSQLSRLWMSCWFATGAILLIVHRLTVYTALRCMRKQGINTKSVVLVGYGEVGREIHRRALVQDWFGYHIKAIHCSAEERNHISDHGISAIENMEDIAQYAINHHVHEIWLTLPITEYDKLQKLQYLLRNALCDIRWMPDAPAISVISRRTIDFLGMLSVDLNRPESHGLRGVAKDMFDKLFALAVLSVLAVPFLIIAACIKHSSPGPVFFRQSRHGLNGKKFLIYKFRTMKLHREQSAVTQATQNDPRVTWIGGFLRRTSIDELPQFINVLMGDMSIVGPRPHALEHNDFYKDALDVYMLRHRVKPGITGWAQINGLRGETDTLDKMEKRVQFDMQYIKHWSFWLDVRIIFWTALKGWTGKNVY